MIHRGGLILCVIAVGVLTAVGGTAGTVFDHDRLDSKTLAPRGCRPDDLPEQDKLPPCIEKIVAGDVPPECIGAPLLAQYQVCFAQSAGLLNEDGTEFNMSVYIRSFSFSPSDEEWNDAAHTLLNECWKESEGYLTVRQQVVYAFSCLRWSLVSNCDLKQAREWRLDEAAALRLARFLSGNCPLSPYRLRNILESISHRTWEECGTKDLGDVGGYHRNYAEFSRIACLLSDFISDSGLIDSSKLKAAITRRTGEFPDSVHRLLAEVIIFCSAKKHNHRWCPVTAQEFVNCWIRRGLHSCVYQEANQVAADFPEDCAIPL